MLSQLYESVARKKDMTNETWDVFIRVVLGVCDFMLEGEELEGVGTKVSQQMVRLLFSMYIRSSHVLSHSSLAVVELWRLLSKYAQRWCHRLTFVENWSTVCYCLTRELFFCVSGSAEEANEATNVDLCIDWGSRSVPVKIITTPESLKFMWNRLVHL